MSDIYPINNHQADALREFVQQILHGDEVHRQWLLDAVEAFIADKPIPSPKSAKGEIA